jgi:hypothetical protein
MKLLYTLNQLFNEFGVQMEKKRVFRQDYISINKEYKFISGDVAIILEENKPNIKIKVDDKAYLLPYRDFIITTRQLKQI